MMTEQDLHQYRMTEGECLMCPEPEPYNPLGAWLMMSAIVVSNTGIGVGIGWLIWGWAA
jgi:hypothetical protein